MYRRGVSEQDEYYDSPELREARRQVAAQRDELRKLIDAFERGFGQKVRAYRQERGWSQEELARRLRDLGLDMHQTTIAKLEAGRRPTRLSEAYAIALAFGLPTLAFFYGSVPGEPWTLADMRQRLEGLDESIKTQTDVINAQVHIYASLEVERLRLADAMRRATARDEHPETS